MDIKTVAEYLASQTDLVFEGPNKDLFIYSMPETVRRGVLLGEEYAGTPIDHELPKYFRTGFQVVIRHEDPVKGRELADEVSDVLTFRGKLIGTLNVRHILPRHQPLVYPVSQGDLFEWSINFDAVYSVAS